MEYNGEYQFTEPGEELQELFDKVDALPNKEELEAELEDIRTGKTMRDGSVSWNNLDENVQNIIETSGGGGGAGLSTTWGNSDRLGITQKKLTEEHEEREAKDAEHDALLAEQGADIAELNNEIDALEKQDVIPVDVLPSVSEADPKAIYRVAGEDSYTDYMVNASGDGWKELAEFSFPGIDEEPTAGSDNLVKSGGVFSTIEKHGKLLYKGVWLYENHLVNHNPGDHQIISNNSWDVLIIKIPHNADTLSVGTIEVDSVFDVWASDDLSLWDGNYFLSTDFTKIGTFPEARYASVSIKKAENPTWAANYIANFQPEWTFKPNIYDSSIECGSDNAPTSNAVYQISPKKFIEEVEGEVRQGYVNPEGIISQISDYEHYLFEDIEEGKIYHVHSPIYPQSSALSFSVFFVTEVLSETAYSIIKIPETSIPIGGRVVDIDLKIPTGVIAIGVDTRESALGAVKVYEAELESVSDYVEEATADMKTDIQTNKANISELLFVEPDSIDAGKFLANDGSIQENAAFSIYKYDVTQGSLYAFSGKHSAGVNIRFLAWMDDNDNIVKWELYGGVSVQYIDQIIQAPEGCSQAWFNVQPSIYPSDYNFKAVGDVILSRDLKAQLLGSMKVTKRGNNVYIRTSFNDTKDIIQFYTQDTNGCMKPSDTWLGDNTLDDESIMVMENRFHHWTDSNAPIFNREFSPWHLFANHGYYVPSVTFVDSPLTSDDEGSIWEDQNGGEFTIGKVVTGGAILLPKITMGEVEGLYTRSWDYGDSIASPLVHVSGGVHTDDLEVAVDSETNKQIISGYQIEPIQESVDRVFLADGNEVGDGTYYCNDFSINETLIGLNPVTTETWFPTPVRVSEMIRLGYSYNFHGLGTRYDITIDVKYPIHCDKFGGNQAQHTLTKTGYDIYVFAPRSKYVVEGHVTDVPFKNNPSDGRSILCYRNTTDCYDVDKMPDRLVSYLQKTADGSKLIGFASGLSLTRGITVDSKRKDYIPSGSLCYDDSIGQNNKMYITAISSDTYGNNHLLPTSLVGTISSYFSYYDPNANEGQVYWYKDGNGFVVYIHSQSASDKRAISLEGDMEGLSATVVDKTDGMALLTDIVVGGKIYVSATSAQNNYIVLKLS